MSNWMKEFLAVFPDATERYTGTRQKLECVEASLSEARQLKEVSAESLRILETNKDWTYPTWWPLLSRVLEAPVKLPASIAKTEDQQIAIQNLYDRLQHIEVASVVLRFLFPEEFGIISPPICTLLALPSSNDHVSYYMSYLKTLRLLRDHYGLSRIADVDMALWSAAHSQHDLPAIAQLMYQDEYFQEIRLKNAFAGLGVLRADFAGRPLENRLLKEHLIIARALLTHDHVLAALICGRSLEMLINVMSSLWGIPRGIIRITQSELRNRFKKIGQFPQFNTLGFNTGDLNRWWDWRNKATHPENQISRSETDEFITQVSQLARKLLPE